MHSQIQCSGMVAASASREPRTAARALALTAGMARGAAIAIAGMVSEQAAIRPMRGGRRWMASPPPPLVGTQRSGGNSCGSHADIPCPDKVLSGQMVA